MSSTRLSAILDGILEAGWLAAIIVTPLFFNIYSSRVFEPDKLTTLRSIALVMAAIWLVRLVEEWANRRERPANQPIVHPTWRTPLVLPTLLTIVVYIVSNVFSVTPYVSFFGSYQRLQGTFTTLSYIVIFFIILDRMRTRSQVDRFITTLILNSLPIALYGFVQHAARDPLPWGGNVTIRVASNMGNAIFVAAYLIMAVPLTLSRVTSAFRAILTDEHTGVVDVLRAAAYIFIVLVQVITIYYTKSRGPLVGLLFGVGLWVLVGLLTLQRNNLQRNPQRNRLWRWLWIATLSAAIVLAVLFFAINPGGPLHDWARANPAIGRLALVLEAESGTGKVRALIWEGALELILPHEPIGFPETIDAAARPDPYNAIRSLIGYGPESMYVAYNRFYPPLLGHYESRNASPDRSHNETLDSLVITGALGFVAYVWLFGSLFYFGLRWLGLLPADWRRVLFFALQVVGVVAFVAWVTVAIGPHFFGLAVPMGMAMGMLVYLIVYAFTLSPTADPAPSLHPHSVLLIGILASVMAHFIEANFGIAIASTRTTFWAMVAMFVLLGLQQIVEQEQPATAPPALSAADPRRRKKRRPTAAAPVAQRATSSIPSWLWLSLGAALIGALILGTLFYDFVNNVERLSDTTQILWHSLTVIAVGGPARTSLGILMVFGVTWLITGLLTVGQMTKWGAFRDKPAEAWSALLIVLIISLAIGVTFGLILAGRHTFVITQQVQSITQALELATYIGSQINTYYVFLTLVIFCGGIALSGSRLWPRRSATPAGPLALAGGLVSLLILVITAASRDSQAGLSLSTLLVSFAIGAGLTVVAGLLVYYLSNSVHERFAAAGWALPGAVVAALLVFLAPVAAHEYNLRPIQADIVFKQADPWERTNQWAVAIPHYQTARDLSPFSREDFYYLYLGRAYLEYATSLSDVAQQDLVLRETEQVLLQAQAINPLNTDHSANLARMYRRWAGLPAGSAQSQVLAEVSSDYYEVATTLSPQNAVLWNEWATLNFYELQNTSGYQRVISHSIELDLDFEQTWMLIGDVRTTSGDYENAIVAYTRALELAPGERRVWNQLGRIHLQVGQNEQAIAAFSEQLSLAPTASDVWDVHRLMAIAYFQSGQFDQAMAEAQTALQLAPEERQDEVQQLIQQLQQSAAPQESTP